MRRDGGGRCGSGRHSNRRICEWHLENLELGVCIELSEEGEEGTDDGSTPRFAIFLQELEKLMTDEDIKIDGNFVKKQDVPRSHKAHAELNATSLAIRNVVHVPVEIDVKQIKQEIPSFFVSITTHGVEKVRDNDVAPDDRIHSPGNG